MWVKKYVNKSLIEFKLYSVYKSHRRVKDRCINNTKYKLLFILISKMHKNLKRTATKISLSCIKNQVYMK